MTPVSWLRFRAICSSLFLLSLTTCFLFAQERVVRFDRLSIEEGLSQATVTAILQDRFGFMWFATQDGLNRYDGYHFLISQHNPDDAHSLADNYIRCMVEDSKGNLWLGTDTNGLDYYDRDRDQFNHLNTTNGLSDNRVLSLAVEKSGRLWAGTNQGLNRIDPQNGQITKYHSDAKTTHPLSNNRVLKMIADESGRLWLGHAKGIDLLEEQKFSAIITSAHACTAFGLDAQGLLWAGFENGSLRVIDRESARPRIDLDPLFAPLSQQNNHRISAIMADKQDNLWIATDGNGLFTLNSNSGQLDHFRHDQNDPQSISNDRILTLTRDHSGALWIGTWGSGINGFDAARNHFKHFYRPTGDKNGLSHNMVMPIYEDRRGDAWIGTIGGGLNHLNQKNGIFTHYRHNPKDPTSLTENQIWAIAQDAPGNLWVGTFRGLNKMDRKSKRFSHYIHDPQNPKSVANNQIISLFLDQKDRFWVGTHGSGLNRYDAENENFIRYPYLPDQPQSVGYPSITVICTAGDKLWLGTYGGGMTLFDPETGDTQRFTTKEGLSHDRVMAILVLEEVWIGTHGGGLNRFDGQHFKSYRRGQGLPNDSVWGVLPEDDRHLWLSTNRGLARFDIETEEFRHFDTRDGLQSDEFNQNASFRGRDGTLYFGGINGFNRFNPAEIKDSSYCPPVRITQLLLHNRIVRPQMPNSPLKQDVATIQSLELDHTQRMFAFEFSSLHFAIPERNQYAYKMEGFDQDWIHTDAQNRRATYTSLPAGRYVFRVKGSNADGRWSDQEVSVNLRLHPPLWLTLKAKLLYSLLLALLIHRYVHLWRRRVKREQTIAQQQRELANIATSMAIKERDTADRLRQVDRLKDEFLANTSHELRTPLNGIIGLAESLVDGARGPLPSPVRNDLQMVMASGRRLANLVNDILDFSKLRNGNLPLNLAPVDVFTLTEVVLNLSKPLIGKRDLQLINLVEANLPPVQADEPRLQQIMHHLLGNAIKFTPAGTIQVQARIEQNRMLISVSDTGIGIAEEKHQTIFSSFEQADGALEREHSGTGLGLAICHRLVALHGGQLKLESQPGKGAVFFFDLPLASAERA